MEKLTLTASDIKDTAAQLIEMALEAQEENYKRFAYKQPTLQDWIIACSAAADLAQRKAS